MYTHESSNAPMAVSSDSIRTQPEGMYGYEDQIRESSGTDPEQQVPSIRHSPPAPGRQNTNSTSLAGTSRTTSSRNRRKRKSPMKLQPNTLIGALNNNADRLTEAFITAAKKNAKAMITSAEITAEAIDRHAKAISASYGINLSPDVQRDASSAPK